MNSRELHAMAMSIKKMRRIAAVAGMSAALCAGTVSAASAASAETVPGAGPTAAAGKTSAADFRGARLYFGENFDVHAFNVVSGTHCRNFDAGARNKISSLKTSSGVAAQLYDKPNCGGASSPWYTGNWDKLGNWNNRAESITVLEV